MSVQILNNLLPVNPAYNDSIITYKSNLFSGATKSDVIIDSKTFTVYPINDEFTYNFKDYVKVKINPNNFEDTIIPNNNFIIDDTTLSLTINPTIKIYPSVTSVTTGDTSNFTYHFTKNVEQLIGYKRKIENDNSTVKVLLPTNNYLDYNLTFFEGYPCDFAIFGLKNGDTFYLKNTTTLNTTQVFNVTTTAVKRIFLSNGNSNSSLTDELVLSNTLNKIELWVNNEFVCNINIRKVNSKCGVMLKWFNASGSYSYWLFNQIFETSIQSKTIENITGDYNNLYNVSSNFNITGKIGTKTLKLNTNFSVFDLETISSLVTSPKVELLIDNQPFNPITKGSFIGVILNDNTLQTTNKTTNNKLNITITLPKLFTQTL